MPAIDNTFRLNSPNSDQIGKIVEDMAFQALMRRRPHERRWYNNNFFDDGLHFRILSQKTGQIIDHVDKVGGFVERALPRASKQIRGIGALLLTPEYYPVVYPARMSEEDYRNKVTGQVDQQRYQQAQDYAKHEAKKRGIFLTTTWEDDLELPISLAQMIILASKHSVSWYQVFNDPETKRITGQVYDAFDIICYGDVDDEEKLPFITKTAAWDFNEVLASPIFDEDKLKDLSPDNIYATSEIKNAYMRGRYGSKQNAQSLNTIIVKETFIKEYLSDDNWKQSIELSKETGAMEGKSKGDVIMRHPWSAGGVTLLDECIDYDNYPFVPLRLEPGLLYSVPLIERFIPLNKSQDVVVTRLEKWINTMVVGMWMQRKNENFQLSNVAGGQVVKFETTPPEQMAVGNVGNTPFQYMEMIDKYIEEQGLTATNPMNLPSGVANSTIENLQQQEYSNMKFATLMLKKCVTKIGQLIMERGDKEIVKPQEITYMEDEKPQYFSVIGSRGKSLHKKINRELPKDIITLDRKAKIRVEADSGMGLTQDGRRQAMQTLMEQMTNLYKEGFLGPQAMSLLVKRFIEEYGFGSTSEFMEAIEQGVTQGQMSQTQIQQMQIALLQVLKDTKSAGPLMDKQLTDSTKLGTLQAMKDVGLLDQLGQEGKQNIEVDDLVKLYKDAPDDLRRQIEQKLGLQPSVSEPIAPSQADSAHKLHQIVKGTKEQELSQRQQEHTEDQAGQQQQLAERQQDASENQAEQQNQLAQQAANQPQTTSK